MLWFFFGLGTFCSLASIVFRDRTLAAAAFGFWGLAIMPFIPGMLSLILWGVIGLSAAISLLPPPTRVLQGDPVQAPNAPPFRQAVCRLCGHNEASGDRA